MGRDIHAHLEVQIDGEWHYYAPLGMPLESRIRNCYILEMGIGIFGNSIGGLLEYPERYPCDDVRLIFWFDN